MGRIGATELIFIFIFISIILVLPFLIGYYFGKKSGYIKRVKEEEDQKK